MALIETVEDAVDAAETFIKRYHHFIFLERVVEEDGGWIVEFDTTIMGPKAVVRIRVDPKTGKITEFTRV